MNAKRSGRQGIISGRKKNFSSLLDKEFTKRRTSKMGSPELQATFDTIVEAFLFLDKNGNGKL
ncbi:hypothetical protein NC653_037732 [Populus alba x Populus x berolinensis]|uniref:EF-hand domain-containing protein n=1 Tax=Populus alba x Populus x berolinensis TaxID=444605 RepID=A0AAD6LF97_9ROSI|nr:hypothetical protein NC653_037732 [Populus alba x Populus x berolinensis]